MKLKPTVSPRGLLWIATISVLFGAALVSGMIPFHVQLLALLLICFLCELMDSSLGMGYGTTLTPLLLFLGYNPLDIVPTILISEFLSGAASWFFHAEAGNVDTQRGSPHLTAALILAGGSVLGIVGGVMIAVRISATALTLLIGIVILGAGLFLLVQSRREFQFRRWKMLALSAVAAFNKGVSGGGYGPLMTTGQVLGGVPGRAAVAVTSFAESWTCLLGAILFLWQGQGVNPDLLIPICCGALVSVPFSAQIVQRVPDRALRQTIAGLTIVLGLLIALRALG